MTAPRHKGGRRPSALAGWSARLTVPAAAVAVLLALGVGFVLVPHPGTTSAADPAPSPAQSPDRAGATVDATERDDERVSRSAQRPEAVPPGRSGVETLAVPEATGQRWARVALNVWTGPGEDTTLVDEIAAGTRVEVTGTQEDGWAEIIHAGMPRWVHSSYLDTHPATPSTSTTTTPAAKAPGTVSFAPCRLGSGVESGLTPDAVRVYRAVCAAFPQVTSYGGLRPGDSGPHGSGQALDIMVSDQALGDEIAAWVIARRSELGVSEVLWWQRIWTVQRSSEGWRPFADRGSRTANHYDHVHVTVYGDSGTG